MNPLLLVDSYKIHHNRMYPEGMSMLYSNFTARKSRLAGVDKIVFFGLQSFIKEFFIDLFRTDFFEKPLDKLIEEYKRHCPVDTTHIEELHRLGYLPLKIKALPEGTRCNMQVPCLTIRNTHPNFGWLTNYFETLMSCQLWQGITSATIAYEYKKLLTKYALQTTGSAEGVQWQAHDFSMRGMSSVASAVLSGMAHLTCFTGTDVIPAIYALERNYRAKGLIGASVPATEHSVMSMGQRESEIETFSRLLDLYPTGILSVVSDTWDLWKVCTEYLPTLKEKILARDGKLVIRPDSGDPVKIITGYTPEELKLIDGKWFPIKGDYTINPMKDKDVSDEEIRGVIELLWDTFGGTYITGNDGKQYRLLDSHIGAIYGDSITLERAEQICERLMAKGFASTNIVFGVGSYTYQYNTRDTFGFAMKATYGEVKTTLVDSEGVSGTWSEPREIWKDPITDDGTKKSRKGLLRVEEKDGNLVVYDQQTWSDEKKGLLQVVFEDGMLIKETTLDEIRDKLK